MDTSTLDDTRTALVAAVQDCVAAERALNAANRADLDIERPSEYADLEMRYSLAADRVRELADALPTPARSQTDVVLRARVAYALADKDRDGRIATSDDEAEESTRRLIEAVHDLAGISYS